MYIPVKSYILYYFHAVFNTTLSQTFPPHSLSTLPSCHHHKNESLFPSPSPSSKHFSFGTTTSTVVVVCFHRCFHKNENLKLSCLA